jgi:archaetidylinositol phosphate synthase
MGCSKKPPFAADDSPCGTYKEISKSKAREDWRQLVLNKVRRALSPVLTSVGSRLNEAGVSANLLTAAGFCLALTAGFLFATFPGKTYLGGLSLLGSGILDILDGSVARASNTVTKAGSFADSTLDRLGELAVFAGIAFGGEGRAFLVALVLGCSFMVSYMRAKGESLNVIVAGLGIGERAERLIVLIVSSLAGYLEYGLYVVLALAVVTIIQRYVGISQQLQASSIKRA